MGMAQSSSMSINTPIEWIRQPNRSTCAQTVVAMLARISIEESIRLYGHRSTTQTSETEKIVKSLGLAKSSFIEPSKNSKEYLDSTCIIRVRAKRCRNGHMILQHGGVIYDPLRGVFADWDTYCLRSNQTIVTSYMKTHSPEELERVAKLLKQEAAE